MAKLVFLITPLIDEAQRVGDAWDDVGVSGVTYIQSHGFFTLKETRHKMSVLPGMMSLMEIMRNNQQNNVTMFTVVQDDALVDKVIEATESVIGDIGRPDNGIMFVIDVDRVLGLRLPDS